MRNWVYLLTLMCVTVLISGTFTYAGLTENGSGNVISAQPTTSPPEVEIIVIPTQSQKEYACSSLPDIWLIVGEIRSLSDDSYQSLFNFIDGDRQRAALFEERESCTALEWAHVMKVGVVDEDLVIQKHEWYIYFVIALVHIEYQGMPLLQSVQTYILRRGSPIESE